MPKKAERQGRSKSGSFTKRELRSLYDRRLERHQRAAEELARIVGRLIKDLGNDEDLRPVPLVQSSVKDFDSFYDKAKRKRKKGRVTDAESCFQEIRDIARGRVICQTLQDVVRFGQILNRLDNEFFLASGAAEEHGPDSNDRGYRSVHYEVAVSVQDGNEPVSVTCELQVCTTLQFAWGLFTHGDVYKGKQLDPFLGSLMRDLSEFLYVADTFAGRVIQRLETPG